MATMTPFQKAFNEAKREGRKTFSFNGKPYSTKTAEEQGREIGAKAATMTPFQKAFNKAKREGQRTFSFNGKPYSTKTAEEQGREIGAKAAAGSGRGMAAGRTASDKDTTSGRAKAAAAPAGRAEIPVGDVKGSAASTERRMSPLEMGLLTTSGALAAPGLRVAVREAIRAAPKVAGMASKAGEAAKGAMSKAGEAVKGAASKASEAAKGAASKAGEAAKGAMSKAGEAVKGAASKASEAAKAAPRVEPSFGRPVTTKLDDAAAAFSRPQARQASKDTGYTRGPSKTTPPQPTRAPKPRDEIIKRQAQMREGRKATEDYARDVKERGAEMGFKKGGMTKGGGCETRGKKARYV